MGIDTNPNNPDRVLRTLQQLSAAIRHNKLNADTVGGLTLNEIVSTAESGGFGDLSGSQVDEYMLAHNARTRGTTNYLMNSNFG